MPQQTPTTQAVAAATVSLIAFAVCVGAFLPPFGGRITSSVPLSIVFGVGIAVSFLLHIAFVGIAAHRAHRSAALWAVVAVLLFPVGSIVGLILFEWFSTQGSDGIQEQFQR